MKPPYKSQTPISKTPCVIDEYLRTVMDMNGNIITKLYNDECHKIAEQNYIIEKQYFIFTSFDCSVKYKVEKKVKDYLIKKIYNDNISCVVLDNDYKLHLSNESFVRLFNKYLDKKDYFTYY
jgi:hypothetical protein